MQKKKIKIKFVDFWAHWNVENNFIINILNKYYDIEFSDEPDYVFFSNFSNTCDHIKYKDAVKIFYTQENLCPDFNFADYGIGYENIDYGDRYLDFPIGYIKERYGKAWEGMKSKNLHIDEKLSRREFCGVVISNKDADSIRNIFWDELSKYKKIDSGGRYRNNVGIPDGVVNKIVFLKDYKFSLCFENSTHPGYYTEKIIEGFAAKTVPIYWGDPGINKVFNERAFINLNNCKTLDEMINRVIEVEQDNNKYLSMLKEPALLPITEEIWEKKQEELESFLCNIFEQEKDAAFRRNRVFWGERYSDLYENMRDWYVICSEDKFLNRFMRLIRWIKNEK